MNRSKSIIPTIIVLAAILAPSFNCTKAKRSPSAPNPKATLRQAWFPWAGYVGELAAAQNFAHIYGLDLRVERGADDIDPIKLVLAGNDDFGVGSAEYVVNANRKGARLYIVGVINYKSPTCFLALAAERVRTFSDFKGKRVGILTGTETHTVYRLLKLRNIIPFDVAEVEAPFDINSFIVTKSYDIRPAYVYDEPISLDAKGIAYTVIQPDPPVSLISGVYFTNERTIMTRPDLVRSFVFSVADGWQHALSHPENAVRLLAQYDQSIDVAKETKSLKAGMPYFSGDAGRILWTTSEHLNDFAQAMVTLGEATETSEVTKWFNLRFVEEYHNGRRGSPKGHDSKN